MEIRNQSVRPSAAGTAERVLLGPALASADCQIEVVLKVFSLDVGPKAGALGRWRLEPPWGAVETTHGYEALYDGLRECWTLTAWRNGKANEIGASSERLSPGLHSMRFRAEGAALSIIVNDVVCISVRDETIVTAGHVGMMVFQEQDISDGRGISIDSIAAFEI